MAKNSNLPNTIQKADSTLEKGCIKAHDWAGPAAPNDIPILLIIHPVSPRAVEGSISSKIYNNVLTTDNEMMIKKKTPNGSGNFIINFSISNSKRAYSIRSKNGFDLMDS